MSPRAAVGGHGMPDIYTPATATDSPGLHVLVVDVSRYPYAAGPDATPIGRGFHLQDLSTAARSASLVADFFLQRYRNTSVPLASLRVLLSPVEGEVIAPAVADALHGREFAATRGNVQWELSQFFAESSRNPENVTITFFTGHGVQVSKYGATVLLEDFAADEMQPGHGAIDLIACHDFFDSERRPARQAWFIDACRTDTPTPNHDRTLSGVLTFDVERGTHCLASPMFMSASSGERAWARTGESSLFTEALIWALEGGGAGPSDDDPPQWVVDTTTLADVLPAQVTGIARTAGVVQTVDVSGRTGRVVLNALAAPPLVDVTLELSDPNFQPHPVVSVRHASHGSIPSSLPFPIDTCGPAGIWSVLREGRDPDPFLVRPPTRRVKRIQVP